MDWHGLRRILLIFRRRQPVRPKAPISLLPERGRQGQPTRPVDDDTERWIGSRRVLNLALTEGAEVIPTMLGHAYEGRAAGTLGDVDKEAVPRFLWKESEAYH